MPEHSTARTASARPAVAAGPPGSGTLLTDDLLATIRSRAAALDRDNGFPHEDLADLALSEEAWETVLCETRDRATTGPDGSAATLIDGVVMLRRR